VLAQVGLSMFKMNEWFSCWSFSSVFHPFVLLDMFCKEDYFILLIRDSIESDIAIYLTGNLCESDCSSDADCADFHCNTALGYFCKYVLSNYHMIIILYCCPGVRLACVLTRRRPQSARLSLTASPKGSALPAPPVPARRTTAPSLGGWRVGTRSRTAERIR